MAEQDLLLLLNFNSLVSVHQGWLCNQQEEYSNHVEEFK